MDENTQRRGWRRWGSIGALMAGSLLAGGLIVGAVSTASAQSDTSGSGGTSSTATPGAPPNRGNVDESKSQRSDETLLTGDDATKVKDAALAKYPGATVLRVETDSDGVYEAHLQTSDGKRVTVEVGKDFAVTGEEAPPADGQGPGGPGK